jgi:hypothetical protein
MREYILHEHLGEHNDEQFRVIVENFESYQSVH